MKGLEKREFEQLEDMCQPHSCDDGVGSADWHAVTVYLESRGLCTEHHCPHCGDYFDLTNAAGRVAMTCYRAVHGAMP